MAAAGGESLESLLNRATNPMNKDEDWEFIMSFCDQVNKELEGPQIAVRLLAHKIQSPQEKEAIYALVTLESCVKNCGKRFHQEIGKFRFLNEIIKVVSPKYLGSHTTTAVKTHCIEMMYSWSTGLKEERKIEEAYQMLKKQGIVTADPVHVDRFSKTFQPPAPPRAKNTVFEDEDKSKMLARLLRSKHPEDLQAANRLIKNMVKQDAERIEKVSKRVTDLETVGNNIKLLTEMLCVYSMTETGDADKDIMKELYDNLEQQRPNLFRLASDTDDKDNEGMTSILKVNDDVVKVMSTYRKLVEGSTEENGLMLADSSLVDLCHSGVSDVGASQVTHSMLDDQLAALGLSDTKPTTKTTDSGEAKPSNIDALEDLFGNQPQSNPGTLLNLALNTPTSGVAHNVGASGLMDQQSSVSGGDLEHMLGGSVPDQQLLDDPLVTQTTQLPSAPLFSTNTSSVPTPTAQGITSLHSLHTGIPPPHPVNPATVHPGNPGITPFPTIQPPGPAPAVQPIQAPRQSTPLQPVMGIFNAGTTPQSGITPKPTTVSWGGTPEASKPKPTPTGPQTTAFDDLDILGKSMTTETQPTQPTAKLPLNQMSMVPTPAANSTPATASVLSPSKPAATVTVQPLTNVIVKLEDIKPGSNPPITAYDKEGLKIIMHIARDSPRDDVLVIVLSVMSTNPSAIKKFTFQAAVPKAMRVKLQPPSATDLPGYNPILPPAAITQVMLIANPYKEKIRLKFKVSYQADDKQKSDVGEVDTFPL